MTPLYAGLIALVATIARQIRNDYSEKERNKWPKLVLLMGSNVARLLQAQSLSGSDLLGAAADQALLQLDLEHLICHGLLPP